MSVRSLGAGYMMPTRQQLTAGSEISLTTIREIDLLPGILFPYLNIPLPLAKRTP
jgi:hypothetical protein